MSLGEITQQVDHELAGLDTAPAIWRERHSRFYLQAGAKVHPFGRATLSFIDWEIKRGVLDPKKGSHWWRAMHRNLLRDCLIAQAVRRDGRIPPTELSGPVFLWCQFLEEPSTKAWYRAHNSSVIAGYLKFAPLAWLENKAEIALINLVLYRVLYAQSLLEVEDPELEPLQLTLRNTFNPSSGNIEKLLQLSSFYPQTYPLPDDKEAARNVVFDPGHEVARELVTVLEDRIILRSLSRLYALASQWTRQPKLGLLTDSNRPIYPSILPPRRIAVLGGGLGAVTTALALTDPDNPEAARNQVTMYQIGWRLGGKGASGRNVEQGMGYRIQEHGLHIWFGFYENSFRTLSNVYKEMVATDAQSGRSIRPPDSPLATMEAAFKPFPTAFIVGGHDSTWSTWYSVMPRNNVAPDARGLLPFDQVVKMAVEFVLLHALPPNEMPLPDATLSWDTTPIHWRALERLQSQISSDLLTEVQFFLRRSPAVQVISQTTGKALAVVLTRAMEAFWHANCQLDPSDFVGRERWAVLNLVYACVMGILKEDLAVKGLDSINDLDFKVWAMKHAHPDGGILESSGYLRSIYDGSFAFKDGDNGLHDQRFPPQADMEAGNTLRNAFRALFTYKQSPIYKMQAGMGDVVFGPIHDVLRERGVRINYFHRVLDLQPSKDLKQIERIHIGRQARVREGGEYRPLVDVRGLPCWPDRPLYEQLEPIKSSTPLEELDLEGYDAVPMEDVFLDAGRDYDDVVMGISLGAIPYVCSKLVENSLAWGNMVKHVKTVATQSVQITTNRTLSELGWKPMMRPVASGFNYDSDNPLETWADMSHLIEREGWPVEPAEEYPRSIIYFCSSFVEPKYPVGAKPDEKQKQATAKVRQEAEQCLPLWHSLIQQGAGKPWSAGIASAPTFPWETLVDHRREVQPGSSPLDAQYFLANVKPSERYVLSVAGSSRYRLPPNDPLEFSNLYLAGDWTDNHVNMGCVEAAVTSGLLCSNALCGFPVREDIAGLEW